jgi:hypothetical protein
LADEHDDSSKGDALPRRSLTSSRRLQRRVRSFSRFINRQYQAVSLGDWRRPTTIASSLPASSAPASAPVAAADKPTLIPAAASLDLTGLPPTDRGGSRRFRRTSRPTRFAKVVDRLLASPRYGETWGRLWLDVARYGEDDYRSLDPEGTRLQPVPERLSVPRLGDQGVQRRHAVRRVRAQPTRRGSDGRRGARAAAAALGFLGLGPWYYDNGAVEITRADERHDKVDVVSRGFLGLTVGCARCHDHKYDPIPTKDYYSLSGVFLNSPYKEYPLAPKGVVDDYTEQDKKIEKKEKLLEEFMRTEGTQLSQTLALQASTYMAAAWRVLGEPKDDVARVVDDQKLDFELFDRWLKFLAKPPKFYPYLTKWQEMVKSGGSAKEAKTLADEFQALLLDVMFERKEVNDENDIIKAKALIGTKKKEPAKLPSDFVTNDDFCPGCGLELKSMPIERQNLWTDGFQRDSGRRLRPGLSVRRIKPGLLLFSGWGLERQAERRPPALLWTVSERHREAAQGSAAEISVRPRRQRRREAVNLKVSLRGSPYNLGDEAPRHFPVDPECGRSRNRSRKAAAASSSADAILKQPISTRVIVNRIWKGHFGTGLVDTPSNFGVTGRAADEPRTARVPGAVVHR